MGSRVSSAGEAPSRQSRPIVQAWEAQDGLPGPGARTAAGPVGEVIEATTTRFMAQCPPERLHSPPIFGAFVKILPPGISASSVLSAKAKEPEDPFADPPARSAAVELAGVPDGTLFALVYAAATSGAEPGRRPAAYGLDEDRLREEQPQIFELLATQFEALHIAHIEGGRLRSSLPPRPPRLHAFVTECGPAEVCALTEAPDLLGRILLAPGPAHADQLVAACLRNAYECRGQDFTFLVRAGKQLAGLLALLRNLEP